MAVGDFIMWPRLIAAAAVGLAALCGCVTHPTPPHGFKAIAVPPTELCVVDNPAVRPGFQQAILQNLTRKQVVARVIPPATGEAGCSAILMYDAHWIVGIDGAWLHSATISVTHNREVLGQAWNRNIFPYQVAASSVDRLMDQIFPDSLDANRYQGRGR
jgi:hypothetical protein